MDKKVKQALESERKYQEAKYPDHKHSVGEYILIMEQCLARAKEMWYAGAETATLNAIRNTTAVGVACMEQHGCHKREAPKKKIILPTQYIPHEDEDQGPPYKDMRGDIFID
jgi:hypothetical protein